MTTTELNQLKFPIGAYQIPETITNKHIEEWIKILSDFPAKIRDLSENLNDEDLVLRYRPNGWTVRQVIHHIADSHHHSYIRFKWAITEDEPVIKAYNEVAWANMHDYEASIELSLLHIQVVHAKLVYFVKGLKASDLEKGFIHPETNDRISLKENLGNYAWHSEHHYAHIEQALKLKFK